MLPREGQRLSCLADHRAPQRHLGMHDSLNTFIVGPARGLRNTVNIVFSWTSIGALR